MLLRILRISAGVPFFPFLVAVGMRLGRGAVLFGGNRYALGDFDVPGCTCFRFYSSGVAPGLSG
jgi:hypothetical protein